MVWVVYIEFLSCFFLFWYYFEFGMGCNIFGIYRVMVFYKNGIKCNIIIIIIIGEYNVKGLYVLLLYILIKFLVVDLE